MLKKVFLIVFDIEVMVSVFFSRIWRAVLMGILAADQTIAVFAFDGCDPPSVLVEPGTLEYSHKAIN